MDLLEGNTKGLKLTPVILVLLLVYTIRLEGVLVELFTGWYDSVFV
jgi:hypothetical protein